MHNLNKKRNNSDILVFIKLSEWSQIGVKVHQVVV